MTDHDPTRSGPPVPAAGGPPLRLSLPEIDSLCHKAARGAGLPWGLAEEAGRAAVWLSQRGLDGPGLVLDWLLTGPGAAPPGPGQWHTPGSPALCPLRLGTALADFALCPQPGLDSVPAAQAMVIGPVLVPGLLLPFVARMARRAGAELVLAKAEAGTGADALCLAPSGNIDGDPASLATPGRPGECLLTLARAAQPPAPAKPAPAPCLTAVAVWRRLDQLALRTTVPASETSRTGAGAAGDDND